MNRSARLAAKENAEVQRQERLAKLASARAKREKDEQAAVEIIKKSNQEGPSRPSFFYQLTLDDESKRFLLRKAERLFQREYIPNLNAIGLAHRSWIRSLTNWKPRGKAPETLYRSLCEHLFAKFHMPSFIWSGLLKPGQRAIVIYLAGGGSLVEAVKNGMISAPLTRKMCHDLMQTVGDVDFVEAIRRVQVRAAGGTEALFNIWKGRFPTLLPQGVEIFWYSVLEWFAKNPMMDTYQIGPLLDYIAHRFQRNPDYSLKGRGVGPMMREMQEWHGELARERAKTLAKGTKFMSSGFNDFIWEKSQTEYWTCEEILTADALHREGQALNHCVSTYAYSISNGATSIWSLRLNDERKLTIEVRNKERKIVQVRGRFNRKAEHAEMKAVIMWAAQNGLAVSQWL